VAMEMGNGKSALLRLTSGLPVTQRQLRVLWQSPVTTYRLHALDLCDQQAWVVAQLSHYRKVGSLTPH
jgi:hypothetical protein